MWFLFKTFILLFIVVYSTREENYYPYFMMLFGYCVVCVQKKNEFIWDFVTFRKKIINGF